MPSYIERLLNGNVKNVSQPGTVGEEGMKPPPAQPSSESDQENDAAAALVSLAGVCSSKKRSLQQQEKDDSAKKHFTTPSFRRGATPRLLVERLRAHGKDGAF